MNVAHQLLLEREGLLAEGVRERYDRLKQVEGLLKEIIDDAGPIIDEDLGYQVSYSHDVTKEWDAGALAKHLHPDDLEKLEYRLVASSVKALIDAGRYTDRELKDCWTGKPRAGPLKFVPLRRSIRT